MNGLWPNHSTNGATGWLNQKSRSEDMAIHVYGCSFLAVRRNIWSQNPGPIENALILEIYTFNQKLPNR